MRSLYDCNPIAVLVYFLAVAGVAMFCMNPLILALSLSGALLFFLLGRPSGGLAASLYSLLLFFTIAIINPIFYHNGVTVLFVVNDSPITLEAMLYGIASAAMMISVLYWFRSFSRIMTGDKLLYIFGAASPKLALILSTALRYLPLFGMQAKRINQTQRALGLYKEDNIIDRLRGGIRVFSVMVTWALENGIVTADSMAARGYGVGRRSYFTIYRFCRSDLLLLACTGVMLAPTACGLAFGSLDFAYYPAIAPAPAAPAAPLSLAAYISYGLLALLPSIIEIKEDIRWRYCLSKI